MTGNVGVGSFGTGESLPIPARVNLDNAHVNVDGDDDPGNVCVGSYSNPTAPQGFVCVYINSRSNINNLLGFVPFGQPTRFGFNVNGSVPAAGPAFFQGSWAYTSP